MNDLQYENRICLFLDVLGFKGQVYGARDSSEEIRRLRNGLLEIYYAFHGRLKLPDDYRTSKKVSQFSDSIVVSYEKTEESSVFHLLFDTYMLHIDLLRHGILVRGAITEGALYHDDRLVFGPALVEAVELEKYAMYPRVILSKEIIAIGMEHHGFWHDSEDEEKSIKSLIEKDSDGAFYVNYFGVSPEDFDDGWDDLIIYLNLLRELIGDSIRKETSAGIKLKYLWMREKFNFMISALHKDNYQTWMGFGIPEDDKASFIALKSIS